MSKLHDSHLNEEQLAAVNCIDSHLRIIAGAGTGKTKVIVERINNLIENHQVNPESILAITFTNKAANELKERIQQRLEANIHASTIHSFCIRVVKSYGHLVSLPSDLVILSSYYQKKILKDLLEFHYPENSMEHKAILQYFSSVKTNNIEPEQQKDLIKIFESYQEYLRKNGYLDFDDILYYTYLIFRDNPEVAKLYADKYRYIHIDEFQDVNWIQIQIVLMMLDGNNNLCVVGDPDQSIYRFRGSDLKHILTLEQSIPSLKTIILDKNYRCTPQILDASNTLIDHNSERFEKALKPTKLSEEKIIVKNFAHIIYQMDYIIEEIERLVATGEARYQDIAILYRANYLGENLAKGLSRAHIPYSIFNMQAFNELKEITDVIACLMIIAYHKENLSDLFLIHLIERSKKGFGPKKIYRLQEYKETNGVSLVDAMNSEIFGSIHSSFLCEFVKVLESVVGANLSLPEKVQSILDFLGIGETNAQEDENIKFFYEEVMRINSPNFDLIDFLENYALLNEHSEEENTDKVNLLTVHRAKGLEFRCVFIYEIRDGVFPIRSSIEDPQELEEERRLAYVAMTRAKDRLYLLYTQDNLKKIHSTFVEEVLQQQRNLLNERRLKAIRPPKEVENVTYRRGMRIQHEEYGAGVILELGVMDMKVAFNHQIGIKTVPIGTKKVRKA